MAWPWDGWGCYKLVSEIEQRKIVVALTDLGGWGCYKLVSELEQRIIVVTFPNLGGWGCYTYWALCFEGSPFFQKYQSFEGKHSMETKD
jgi:hypothetical protein